MNQHNLYRGKLAFKIGVLALFVMLMPATASAVVDCSAISGNLSVGSSGFGVKALQQLLNSNPKTAVLAPGPGSLGFETTYFGPKTKLAVMKFQELYANEVLLPVGLTQGNGFVGSYSRAKLASLCKSMSVPITPVVPPPAPLPTPTPTPTPTPLPVPSPAPTPTPVTMPTTTQSTLAPISGLTSKVPVLMFISKNAAPRNTKIALSALGTTETDNTIHLDEFTIPRVAMSAGGGLEFVIPANAPRGKHDLWITNSKGTSNKLFLIITDPAIPGPVVTGYTPKEGWLSTVVTVTGSGFTPNGNEIRIGYGWIKGITSSDGKTLQFTVSPDAPMATQGADTAGIDMSVPLWFSIINENGLTGSSLFTLKI